MAVMVTLLLIGTAIRAVKVTATPLAEPVVERLPQELLEQESVQVSPAFPGSPVTVPVIGRGVPTSIEPVVGVRLTPIADVIVIEAEAEMVGSAAEVAVMVTELGLGTTAGGV